MRAAPVVCGSGRIGGKLIKALIGTENLWLNKSQLPTVSRIGCLANMMSVVSLG